MKTATTFFGILVAVLAVTVLLFSAVLFGYRNEYSIRAEELADTVFQMAKALDQNSETAVAQVVGFEKSNPGAGIPDSGPLSGKQFHADTQIGGASYEGFERFYKQLLSKRENLDQPEFKKRLSGAVSHAKNIVSQRDRLAWALKEASRIMPMPEISEEKLRTQKMAEATAAAPATPAPAPDAGTPPAAPPGAAPEAGTPPGAPPGAAADAPPGAGAPAATPAPVAEAAAPSPTTGRYLYEDEISRLLGFLNAVKERDDNLIQYLISIADVVNVKFDASIFKIPDEQGHFDVTGTLKNIFNQVSAFKRRADDTTATLYESAVTLQTVVLHDEPIDFRLRNPGDLRQPGYKSALTSYQADIREVVNRLNSINALKSDIQAKQNTIDTLKRLNIEKDSILNDELKLRQWYEKHFGPLGGSDEVEGAGTPEPPPPMMPLGHRARILRWDATNGFAILGCAKNTCKHDPRRSDYKFCEACGRRQGAMVGMEFMIVADRRNGQASRTLGRLRISEIQRDSAVGIWSNPYNVNPNDIQAGDFVLLVESPYKTGDVSLPESEAEAAKSAKLSEPDAGKTDEEGPKKKTEEPLPKKKKAEDQGSGEGW